MTPSRSQCKPVLPVLPFLAVLALTLSACSSDESTAETTSSSSIEGVQIFPDLTRVHTEDDVNYPQSPPVGGDHDPVWLDCNGEVYLEPVRNENAVHSLEHGAVWVTYQPDLDEADVKVLANKVKGQPYTFMSPYPDQPAPIMLTAWGLQLSVDDSSDARIDEFLRTYRHGPQTPEPGATCDGGVMP